MLKSNSFKSQLVGISLVLNIQTLCGSHNLLPRLPEGLEDGVDAREEGGGGEPVHENSPVVFVVVGRLPGLAQHEGLGLVDDVEPHGHAAAGPRLEAELAEDGALGVRVAHVPDVLQLWGAAYEEPPHVRLGRKNKDFLKGRIKGFLVVSVMRKDLPGSC